MIYEWKCVHCGGIEEIEGPVSEHDREPDFDCPACGEVEWMRIMSLPHIPFETLRDKGVFERLEKYT